MPNLSATFRIKRGYLTENPISRLDFAEVKRTEVETIAAAPGRRASLFYGWLYLENTCTELANPLRIRNYGKGGCGAMSSAPLVRVTL
jgi:hypothetical protein